MPAAGKYFGFNDSSYLIRTRGIDAAELAQLANGAGANAARLNMDWRYLESRRDVWNEDTWAVHEAYYDELVQRGMKPLLTIGNAPPWARDQTAQNCLSHNECEFPPTRGMLGEWKEFAAEVTRRFPEAAVSVWNEPNIYQNWNHPSPERWAELVVGAHDAIKAVHPNVTVLAGGLAINQGSEWSLTAGRSMPLRTFLSRAYAATPSIKGHMDAIGLNANAKSLDYGPDTLFAKGLHDIRTVRADFNDPDRHIWITESWLSTSGEQNYSQAKQADGLLRQYRRTMTMGDVDAFFIHALVDVTESPVGSWDRGVGLTWINGIAGRIEPKQSYCAFAGRTNTATPALGCPVIDE